MFGVHGAATVLRRGVLHGSGSFDVVQWAPLLTSTNARPELRDRRSCVHDLKTTAAWWRSRGEYFGEGSCMAAAGWRGTSSGTTALARWAACRLLLGWWCGVVVLYGVELSCATVLISYSNRLLFELSLRGVARLFWPVVTSLCLLWCLVPLFNIIGSSPA